MKFFTQFFNATSRARDARTVGEIAYDNGETDCDHQFGSIVIERSANGFFRAYDTYDSTCTLWYSDRAKVERAAQRQAVRLAGRKGSVR